MSVPEVRSDLVALSGYHSAQVPARVRLNTNESPYAPAPEVLEELAHRLGALSLNRYPDRRALSLRAAVGAHEGQPVERVYCANGSNEVLQSLLLAYGGPGRSAAVFEPTYALHSHIARVTGTGVIALSRSERYTLTPEVVAAAVEGHRPMLTFLCSPNNPTGLSEPLEVVAAALSAGDGLVVVDEAYGQFAPHSAVELFDQPGGERLVVVRTFSKTWGLAGVRLGYGLCHPEVVEACFGVALPYHLSSLSQAAGCTVLEHRAQMDAHVAAIVTERGRVLDRLARLDVEVWPSEANFVLFRPRSTSASAVWQGLVDRSVLIRDCSTWRSLEGCLRVTIGTPEENTTFLEALEETL